MAAQQTGEAALILLTLDHDDLGTPLRVTSDQVNTTSRGDTYYAYYFDFQLPVDSGERQPIARLSIDNVDRAILEAVRAISSPLDVTMEIVLGSTPDTVEASWQGFKLVRVTYDVLTVSGDLVMENFMSEPYPAGSFTPTLFPGVF